MSPLKPSAPVPANGMMVPGATPGQRTLGVRVEEGDEEYERETENDEEYERETEEVGRAVCDKADDETVGERVVDGVVADVTDELNVSDRVAAGVPVEVEVTVPVAEGGGVEVVEGVAAEVPDELDVSDGVTVPVAEGGGVEVIEGVAAGRQGRATPEEAKMAGTLI